LLEVVRAVRKSRTTHFSKIAIDSRCVSNWKMSNG